jgi:hypothetical protein
LEGDATSQEPAVYVPVATAERNDESYAYQEKVEL